MVRYFCDKCGKEVNEDEDLSKITISRPMYNNIIYDICEECREYIIDILINDK